MQNNIFKVQNFKTYHLALPFLILSCTITIMQGSELDFPTYVASNIHSLNIQAYNHVIKNEPTDKSILGIVLERNKFIIDTHGNGIILGHILLDPQKNPF